MSEDGFGERLFGHLSRGRADAEYELDLTGIDRAHGLESVRRMLERGRFAEPREIVIRLEPPRPGGGETLFQPVGRLLLEARRAGVLAVLAPLPPESGIGYRIETVGKPRTPEQADDGSDDGAPQRP